MQIREKACIIISFVMFLRKSPKIIEQRKKKKSFSPEAILFSNDLISSVKFPID